MNTLKNKKNVKKINNKSKRHNKAKLPKRKLTKNNGKVRKNKGKLTKRKLRVNKKQRGGKFFNFHNSPHMVPISKFGILPNGVYLPENSNILHGLGYVQNGGFVNLGYLDHLTNGLDYVKYGALNQMDNFLGNNYSAVNPIPYQQNM